MVVRGLHISGSVLLMFFILFSISLSNVAKVLMTRNIFHIFFHSLQLYCICLYIVLFYKLLISHLSCLIIYRERITFNPKVRMHIIRMVTTVSFRAYLVFISMFCHTKWCTSATPTNIKQIVRFGIFGIQSK